MSLPKLLAGPIVRRVERDQISIWVALSGNHKVTASIWPGLHKSPAIEVAKAEVLDVQPKKLGTNLWIALITLKLKGALNLLASGRIFSYDIVVGGDNLKALGLLEDVPAIGDPEDLDFKPARLALGYGKNQLPSFTTPQEDLENVVVAHASCRRPHGPGEDAIAALDDVIGGALSDAEKRPQQLFLTGDQIYADDVALPLLPMLNRLGNALFGFDEQLIKTNGKFVPVITQLDPTGLPAGRRKHICEKEAKFTSGSASSHLISLPEFAAMYLCAFSPDAWQALESELAVFEPQSNTIDPDIPLNDLKEEKRETYKDELRDIAAYRRAVPAARRALANVATYMIFDDHEITDDWNLTRQWREEVLDSATGRQILRNGLVAYGFFQGWGNDPDAFSKKANKVFLEVSANLLQADGKHDPTVADDIDKLLRHGAKLTPQEQLDEDDHRVKWYTTLKCPNYDVVIMDTRTVRKFTGEFTPPDLAGDYLEKQIKGDKAKAFLLLISAAPVLAPPLIDRIGQPIGSAALELNNTLFGDGAPEFTGTGADSLEIEGWGADEFAQEALLKKIAPFKKVLILSGDVHYGCSMAMDYWRDTSPRADRIVQLVSSGTHNWFHKILVAFNRASLLASEVFGIGLTAERLAWDSNETPINLPPDTNLSPARRARMRWEPVLLPAHGWPANAMLNSQNMPSWRWRLKLVYDNRPDSERPSAASIPPFGTDINFDDAIDDYFRVAGHHNGHSATAPNHRAFVFEPNLGVVKLSGSGDALKVTHDLHSQDVTFPAKHAVNTQHSIGFVSTTEPRPELKQ